MNLFGHSVGASQSSTKGFLRRLLFEEEPEVSAIDYLMAHRTMLAKYTPADLEKFRPQLDKLYQDAKPHEHTVFGIMEAVMSDPPDDPNDITTYGTHLLELVRSNPKPDSSELRTYTRSILWKLTEKQNLSTQNVAHVVEIIDTLEGVPSVLWQFIAMSDTGFPDDHLMRFCCQLKAIKDATGHCGKETLNYFNSILAECQDKDILECVDEVVKIAEDRRERAAAIIMMGLPFVMSVLTEFKSSDIGVFADYAERLLLGRIGLPSKKHEHVLIEFSSAERMDGFSKIMIDLKINLQKRCTLEVLDEILNLGEKAGDQYVAAFDMLGAAVKYLPDPLTVDDVRKCNQSILNIIAAVESRAHDKDIFDRDTHQDQNLQDAVRFVKTNIINAARFFAPDVLNVIVRHTGVREDDRMRCNPVQKAFSFMNIRYAYYREIDYTGTDFKFLVGLFDLENLRDVVFDRTEISQLIERNRQMLEQNADACGQPVAAGQPPTPTMSPS